jgi:tRNA wybutosine-synthesizing protein 4
MLDVLADTNSKVKAECLPLNKIYNSKLNLQGERTRIEKIEMFDEFEEWELLQSHYCVCLAVRMRSDIEPHPLETLSI